MLCNQKLRRAISTSYLHRIKAGNLLLELHGDKIDSRLGEILVAGSSSNAQQGMKVDSVINPTSSETTKGRGATRRLGAEYDLFGKNGPRYMLRTGKNGHGQQTSYGSHNSPYDVHFFHSL